AGDISLIQFLYICSFIKHKTKYLNAFYNLQMRILLQALEVPICNDNHYLESFKYDFRLRTLPLATKIIETSLLYIYEGPKKIEYEADIGLVIITIPSKIDKELVKINYEVTDTWMSTNINITPNSELHLEFISF